MKIICKNALIAFLIIICANFHLPQNCYGQEIKSQSTATIYPELVSTPEKEIESVSQMNKWWIIAIAVVVVGVIAAAAGGGGGGGSSSSSAAPSSGNVQFSW